MTFSVKVVQNSMNAFLESCIKQYQFEFPIQRDALLLNIFPEFESHCRLPSLIIILFTYPSHFVYDMAQAECFSFEEEIKLPFILWGSIPTCQDDKVRLLGCTRVAHYDSSTLGRDLLQPWRPWFRSWIDLVYDQNLSD